MTDFEASWRRRFIERGQRFDDDAAIAGWTPVGLAARLKNFRRVWPGAEAGQHWLDAGCGAGTYARFLAATGLRVVAVDYSLPSVQKARERSPDGILWAAADVRRLPLPDASVDGAMCFGVLQALAAPEGALAELMRVLRPGGELWVDALNAACAPTWARGMAGRLHGRPAGLRYDRAPALAERLRGLGATEIRVHWIPILPPRFARFQPLFETEAFRSVLRRAGPLASPLSHAILLSARKGG